jgi:hypothetical protein
VCNELYTIIENEIRRHTMNNSNDMQEINVANIFLGALCILVTAPFWMVMTICLMIANLWFAFKEFVLEN